MHVYCAYPYCVIFHYSIGFHAFAELDAGGVVCVFWYAERQGEPRVQCMEHAGFCPSLLCCVLSLMLAVWRMVVCGFGLYHDLWAEVRSVVSVVEVPCGHSTC